MMKCSLLATTIKRLQLEKRPSRFLASRLLWKTGICRLFTIERHGYRIRFQPTAMSASLWVDNEYSARDEEFFRALLKPGDVVIDVGANIGALTLCAAAAVGPSGNVFSIEAHPLTFRYLTRNLRLNRCTNVEAYNLAMGDKRDQVTFTNQRSDDQNAVTSDGLGIKIDLCPLDEVIPGEAPVALLKIDVEGYELFVLRGAAHTLERTQVLFFESWQRHFARYGCSLSDIITLLDSKGFSLYRQTGPRNFLQIEAGETSEQCENLLALRNADEFISRTGFELHNTQAVPPICLPSAENILSLPIGS